VQEKKKKDEKERSDGNEKAVKQKGGLSGDGC
jgi:hypothetical protein